MRIDSRCSLEGAVRERQVFDGHRRIAKPSWCVSARFLHGETWLGPVCDTFNNHTYRRGPWFFVAF